MNKTSPKTRKLLAGIAAVVLTLGAAGAAVAVNLGTGSAVETPAGRLSATEPAGTPQTPSGATPSTLYVDMTVPTDPAPTSSYDDHDSDDDSDHGKDRDHGNDDHRDSKSDEHDGADDDD